MANEKVVKLLDYIFDSLDIPESYYRRAGDRHRSLGEWLCRPESKMALFHPHVTPQGSFRYGTVTRPLCADSEYDLDNVVTMDLPKTSITQKDLKSLLGYEIKSYAEAHQMLEPIEEMNRCWRLHYADEVTFHLDSLPCVAEEQNIIAALQGRGVPQELAKRAVAITDKRHPEYRAITQNWLSSNPRGFARWFEDRTRPYALPRLQRLVEMRIYSSVEDVPSYEWKTPLQRSIQLLKRHRDVMFQDNPELAPISMIITNLSTHAYGGERDVFKAVTRIVERMPDFIRPNRPRIPNPADPAEDYADKWSKDPRLEQNFWLWQAQVKADLGQLPELVRGNHLASQVGKVFALNLRQDQLRDFQPEPHHTVNIISSAPAVAIAGAVRPWGANA